MSNEKMSDDVYNFLKALLNPDKYGMAVTGEVRDEARSLLGMKRVEGFKVGQDIHAVKGYN